MIHFGTSRACLALVALGTGCAFAQMHSPISTQTGVVPPDALPPALQGVGVQEHLGRMIDLNLTFEDEAGAKVDLKDFFHPGRPVVLDLVYYRCPMLCNLVLNGQTEVMREMPWTPGNEYEVVTITIDPHESRQLAAQKKAQHLATYGRPAPGWHFLTDYAGNAKRLADQVGFLYHYDARQDQFAHPAAITILTPQGKVSRYLYGVRYKSRDVRFALAEASENRTTMTIEKVLLFCYHYDPQANSYTLFATNLMKGGGVLTVLLLGLYLLKAHRNPVGKRGRTLPPARRSEGFV
ncbi:MAG TPA: SCO family protein [Bryobacteraceae bacterium]|nr:SCO family protein [Bryobacteraceae bacterium]